MAPKQPPQKEKEREIAPPPLTAERQQEHVGREQEQQVFQEANALKALMSEMASAPVNRETGTAAIVERMVRAVERMPGGPVQSTIDMIHFILAIDEVYLPGPVHICSIWSECAYRNDEVLRSPYLSTPYPIALKDFKMLPAFIGRELVLHKKPWWMSGVPPCTKSFTSDKGFFTAGELVDCIVEAERAAMSRFGQIDHGHVCFESLKQKCDAESNPISGHYEAFYGS